MKLSLSLTIVSSLHSGSTRTGMPGQQAGRVPIMRMFGVTDEGNSVCAHVHGFSPYFYVKCPQIFKEKHLAPFKVGLVLRLMCIIVLNRDSYIAVAFL